jgi:hypothetical protein
MASPKTPTAATNSRNLALEPFPLDGVFTDQFWSLFFGEDVKTFRQKIRSCGVPHKVWGAAMLVAAKDLLDSMGSDQ